MKKIICFFLTVITVILCFVGCSKPQSTNTTADVNQSETEYTSVETTETTESTTEAQIKRFGDLDFKVNGTSVDLLNLTGGQFCELTGFEVVGDKNEKIETFGHLLLKKGNQSLYLDVKNSEEEPKSILDCKVNGITDKYEGTLNYGDYNPVSNGVSVNGIKVGDAVKYQDIEKALNMTATSDPDTEDFGIVTFSGFAENPYYDLCFTITDGKIDSIYLVYVI